MKKKWLWILAAAALSLTLFVALPRVGASDLSTVKSDAVAELEQYKDNLTVVEGTYCKSRIAEMDRLVTSGTAQINRATDEDGVATALGEAKTSLDDVPTFAEEKAAAKLELSKYVDLDDYSEENQETITAILEDYYTKIDEADWSLAINHVAYLVTAAKNELKRVETLEEGNTTQSFYEKYIRHTFVGRVINILKNNYPILFKAIGMTLLFSLVMVIVGTLLGVVLAIMRMSGVKILQGIATAYIEIIRGIPLLLQLTVIYIVFYKSLGAFWAVSVALFLNSSAYVAEIIRSGIQAVDPGQMEAARSLGLSFGQSMLRIILPQAVKNILPALVNEFVTDIKETSLASTFAAGELMTFQKIITGYSFLTLEPATIIAIVYFIMTFTISKLIGKLEKRLKASD